MLRDEGNKDYDNVFGITYSKAEDEIKRIEYILKERQHKGFVSMEQCAKFAHENHLDLTVFMKSLGTYRNVNHRGDALTQSSWRQLYKQILFWTEGNEEEEFKTFYYTASDYENLISSRFYGEKTDGKYMPLYHRNYFVPTGYFDEAKGTFNVAQPITTFARHTGADTSFVHIFLQHISGECYPYVFVVATC